MSMNEHLAAMYGTAGTAEEAAVQTESFEAFAKVAAEAGINLAEMSEEEIADLYKQATAEDPDAAGAATAEGATPEEAELLKAASAEWDEQAKLSADAQHAEYMGQVMAHSFAAEVSEIEKAASKAGRVGDALKNLGSHAAAGAKGKGVGDSAKNLKNLVKSRLRFGSDKGLSPAGVKANKDAAGANKRAIKGEAKNLAKALGRTGAVYGGGAAAAGGAGYGASKMASFEHAAQAWAANTAVELGYDADDACEKIAAVELEPSPKLASVSDFETGLQVRGLEYLDAVGVPVDWDQVQL